MIEVVSFLLRLVFPARAGINRPASRRPVSRSFDHDCAINRHPARVGLQSPGATDIMRPARLTTLSMGALLVLPQRYSVYQVRSGRKQPRQMTCVPGCSWQGPHPFQALSPPPSQHAASSLIQSICLYFFLSAKRNIHFRHVALYILFFICKFI